MAALLLALVVLVAMVAGFRYDDVRISDLGTGLSMLGVGLAQSTWRRLFRYKLDDDSWTFSVPAFLVMSLFASLQFAEAFSWI